MALLSYAHTGGTAFATKVTLNAADLNDNFFGTSSTTGVLGLLNPTATTGGLEEVNNLHASSGFLPLQFKEPFGRGAVYGHTIGSSATTPTYTIAPVSGTPANILQPAYTLLDVLTIPENGFLTRTSVYIAATTGAAIEEAFPLTFRVLLNEQLQAQRSSGVRQFKSKNPGIIVVTAETSNTTGNAGRWAANSVIQVSKGDVLYFFIEPDENDISGAITVNLKWNLTFKFLQHGGAIP